MISLPTRKENEIAQEGVTRAGRSIFTAAHCHTLSESDNHDGHSTDNRLVQPRNPNKVYTTNPVDLYDMSTGVVVHSHYSCRIQRAEQVGWTASQDQVISEPILYQAAIHGNEGGLGCLDLSTGTLNLVGTLLYANETAFAVRVSGTNVFLGLTGDLKNTSTATELHPWDSNNPEILQGVSYAISAVYRQSTW